MDVDEEYEWLEQAQKEWKKFQRINGYHSADVQVCATCSHVDFGYEGEISCEHPERYNPKLGNWSVSFVDHVDTCSKWE
jgi:hypothetical protein